MTRDLDDRLAARFARQDDPALRPPAAFDPVRARAAEVERGRRRRRRLLALAAVLAATLAAVPAIAVSRTLVDRWFGTPVTPGLRDYIGRVLRVRPGSFATPPRYVGGVRTTRGLVMVWAGRRAGGTQCTGVQAAFGDADIDRQLKLTGGTIADNGVLCSDTVSPVDSTNAGLTAGQGLGSVYVQYGQVPARVHAVRVTFEDGTTRTAAAFRGWVILALERGTRRPGHRPLLEQALDAHGRAIATQRLDPWDYGGSELPPPPLTGPGSRLLATVATLSGPVQLRLSAPGLGWQRRQCWGVMLHRRPTSILCGYPAGVDPSAPPPATNNLYLFGTTTPLPGVVIAMATRIDRAWLVAADNSISRGRVVRFTLAGQPQIVIAAPTLRGRRALTGIVTSRDGRIVGALLMASRADGVPWGATAPCFLAVPSAGAPPPTPACMALIASARRAAGGRLAP